MATTYSTKAQAQAAYDAILKQKQRVQRDDYINQQQALKSVDNYLRQQGYNGGPAESLRLRALGNRTDVSSYDSSLAELSAILAGFKSSGGSGGNGSSTTKNATNVTAGALPAASAALAGVNAIKKKSGANGVGALAAANGTAAALNSLYSRFQNTK